MKLGTLSASSLGGRVGDLGAERQSHGMKFHKAESKGLASGSNQSLSWKLSEMGPRRQAGRLGATTPWGPGHFPALRL